MIKVVHYINQFYAGIGGEDKADYKPEVREEPVGQEHNLIPYLKAKQK